MKRYSSEFIENIVSQVLPPNAKMIIEVSEESGIPQGTISRWKSRYMKKEKSVPKGSTNPENWSGEQKLTVVIETAALNISELSKYCRRKGLYPEQVQRWKKAAIAGNASQKQSMTREQQKEVKIDKDRIRQLEKELRRKEKALAEAAALIILKKKAQAIWGDNEDE